MARFFRNTGALHGTRPGRVFREGEWVTDKHARTGDVFEPEDAEARRFAYKLEEVNPATLPPDPERPGVAGPGTGEAFEEAAEEAAPDPEEGDAPTVAEPTPNTAAAAEPVALPAEKQPPSTPKKKTAGVVARARDAARSAAERRGEEFEEEVPIADVRSYYTGGGMYTLPGGERVKGKAAAGPRLEEILGREVAGWRDEEEG